MIFCGQQGHVNRKIARETACSEAVHESCIRNWGCQCIENGLYVSNLFSIHILAEGYPLVGW